MNNKENFTAITVPKIHSRNPATNKQSAILTDEIKWNRYWRLRQIIKTKGGTNKVAEILQKKNSYITQIASDDPKRAIGLKVASQIERAFGLLPGALDQAPPEGALVDDHLLREISSSLSCATEKEKAMILQIIKVIVRLGNSSTE